MQTTAFLGAAHIHTPDFVNRIKARTDIAVKYVYDHNAKRAAANADNLGAAVAGIDTILADPEVTSAIICSETRHHPELVTKAAAAGKHLFVEKPLGITGESASAMAQAIKNAGVVFQTGFFSRGAAHNQFIRQEVLAGHLGRVTRMRYTQCHQGSLGGWFDTQWRWIADATEAGGGAYADLGAHALDIILWVLGPVSGLAVKFSASIAGATGRYGDIDEYGAGLVTFENGAIGIMEASWVDPKLRAPIEVHGTKGEIIVKDGQVYYYSELVEGADGGVWSDLPAALPHAFENFFDRLEGKDVPLISVEEAAEETRVMHELYKAAGLG